jgi:hypothetical protein
MLMRSLVDLSARCDRIVDLADWVEISTFFRDDKSISEEDLARSLIREGGARFEKAAREKAEAAFDELSSRAEAVGTTDENPVALYPFKLEGTVLTLVQDPFRDDHAGLLYSFLLAITRASMESTSRQLNAIDPTGLFEEICAEALCQFWGGRTPISDVFVAGTSNKTLPKQKKGRYPTIINAIAKNLQEGVGWKKTARSPGAGDGGLDVVVWRRFNDKRPGGLVGFAQCKTGDSWRDHLGKNNPESIAHKFFTTPLVLAPMAIYMVPCRVDEEEWEHTMRSHKGLLLDRCRITTFGTKLSDEIITRCTSWLQAAIEREQQKLATQEEVAVKAVHDEAAAT